jgi:methyl-galactoside transport system substrate-binding protein
MKPWIILFAAFMLFNCQGNKQQVFLLAYNLEDPYLAGFVERIGDKAQGLFTLHIYDVQNSQLVQNQILEDILREDPALILFNPVDRLASYAIIEKLKQRNIPVIFFNREPLHQDLLCGSPGGAVCPIAGGSCHLSVSGGSDHYESSGP